MLFKILDKKAVNETNASSIEITKYRQSIAVSLNNRNQFRASTTAKKLKKDEEYDL